MVVSVVTASSSQRDRRRAGMAENSAALGGPAHLQELLGIPDQSGAVDVQPRYQP
jgi:hypothetical protein